MNKEEFLKELNVRLKYLPENDRADAIRFYDEYISEMELEEGEDIVEKLGTPREVASDIISQCTQKRMDNVEEQKTVRGRATTVWLIILGLLSLPLSLPIAIVAFVCIIVFIVMIIVMLAVAFCGALAIPVSLFVPGIPNKIFTLGYGLLSMGGGILLSYGLIYILGKVFKSITSKKRARMIINE
ncbi:MAG: DUF1700 domain-containing protein [Butyrivibrio sp.]|nr:DUF1700 domain-containing protein [Butyrivibrio sp.]